MSGCGCVIFTPALLDSQVPHVFDGLVRIETECPVNSRRRGVRPSQKTDYSAVAISSGLRLLLLLFRLSFDLPISSLRSERAAVFGRNLHTRGEPTLCCGSTPNSRVQLYASPHVEDDAAMNRWRSLTMRLYSIFFMSPSR